MKNKTDTLTFVGNHPETNKPICGLLTRDFDVEHIPFYFQVVNDDIIILTASKQASYSAPSELILAIKLGADFYVANVGGSETSHIAKARTATN
jgi:hypothetical protein